MTRKLTGIALFLTACLLATAVLSSCGGDEDGETTQTIPYVPVSEEGSGEGSLDARIEALRQLELTVEVVTDGRSTVIWSQKAGSWRWEDPGDQETYVIHNASLNKTWSVSNGAASEIGDSAFQQYMGMSPASMLSLYAALPATSSDDDSWELNLPGKGSLSIEFKGPEGLPTRLTSADSATGETEVIEFRYTDVGSVPDSLFELPAGVQVQPAPAGGGIDITVPQP